MANVFAEQVHLDARGLAVGPDVRVVDLIRDDKTASPPDARSPRI
jgi:hypothetical protein